MTSIQHRVRYALTASIALIGAVSTLALTPAGVSAGVLDEEPLTTFGELGSGAGQLEFVEGIGGIAADPDSGHVFVAESGNDRISEFTAWGLFVKAWGWGVRDGSPELQTCTEATGCQAGLPGSGTGQLLDPSGIAVAPSGAVYVYDARNRRLQAFNPDGSFLRSIGGDVVAHGPGDSTNEEVQELTVAASSGSFKLTFPDPFGTGEAKQTPALPYNASAAEVQAALNALDTIGGLSGSVAVSGGPGSPTGSVPYEIAFQGNLAGDDVPQVKIDTSDLGPAAIGARLVCSDPTEKGEGESTTYEWLRNGVPIAGASSQVYVTTAADEGKAVQCLAALHFAETGVAQAADSFHVAPPAPGTEPPTLLTKLLPVVEMDFSYNLNLGSTNPATLKCDPGTGQWQNATSFSYSWYRNGVRIAGANAQEHVVTPAEKAEPAAFQCGVTASNAGGSVTGMTGALVTTNPLPIDHPVFGNSISEMPSISMEPIRTLAEGGDPEVCSTTATCKVGRRGTTGGELAAEGAFNTTGGDSLDIAPDGTIYAGDWGRVQKLAADGTFDSSLTLASSLWHPSFFPMPRSLALGPEGDVFVSFVAQIQNISDATSMPAYRISAAGAELYALPTFRAEGLAAGADGVAFATDLAGVKNPFVEDLVLREFDASGGLLASCCNLEFPGDGPSQAIPALATNVVTAAGGVALYSVRDTGGNAQRNASIEMIGAPPDKWPPPLASPEVNAQFASSVGSESAVLKAEIDPNFWADTSYQLEYGTAPCSGGGCEALPERQLGAGVVRKDVTTDGVVLSGLEPGATYHYRFVAESSGGGPIFGPDRSFTTFALPKQVSSACPNQALRTGPSAALADCRAYEMVSPVDKLGADISVFNQSIGYPARLDQGSTSGEKITYSATAAFGDAPAGPYSSQYLSARGAQGWSTNGISPPRDSGSVLTIFDALDAQYKAFAEDLSSGWVLQDSDFSLAAGSVPGFANLYRRDNLAGGYEALTTVEPPERDAGSYVPELEGVSADGKHTVFTVEDKLTPDALASTEISQLYESFEGQLRLVSVRPNGTPSTESSIAGSSGGGFTVNREDNLAGAVSADGRLIYWSEESGSNRRLFVRVEGGETVAVSVGPATFWTASPDGKKALYTEAGRLRRFDEQTRTSTTLVASGVQGVMGASEDLSRIYFVSTSTLAEGATAGQANLYLHEDGEALRLIATLPSQEAPGDAVAAKNRPVALNPVERLSRVTPDGATALFMTRGALTGADNTDLVNGKADAEVFRYDAEADELACVSCIPTGARPRGREDDRGGDYWYASSIPGWEMQFHAPRVLSDDGNRAFFNSLNRLVLADTNGRQDVYQWEAEGAGECADSSAPGFNSTHGGCVSLISDGKGPATAEFIDASTDGQDVFFFTETSLLPQDIGQIDVYDARVEGGFPQPPAPAAECEGEACQSPVSPPAEPSYASQGYQGPGNPKPAAKKAKKAKKKSAKAKKKKAKQRKARQQRNTGGRR